MATDTNATKTKAKVKATPKASAASPKPAKDVLDNIDGIVDVVILDDDIFDIMY